MSDVRRHRPSLLLPALLAVSLVASSAQAANGLDALPRGAGEIIPGVACPAIFGTADSRERNRRRRLSWMRGIASSAIRHTIESSAVWPRPRPISVRGIALRRIETQRGESSVAIVRYLPPAGSVPVCQPGKYAIRVDDSLGRGTSVVGIVDDALVIAHGSKLFYVALPNHGPPSWRMIWHSRWTIWLPRPPRGAPTRWSAPAPSRPPTPPKKPRR